MKDEFYWTIRLCLTIGFVMGIVGATIAFIWTGLVK
jgi:hypothetical protein